ncbi:Bestrophin homolog 18 [Durusdinium trenchii]
MLFFTMRGTVFTSPALWVEQFVILALFVGMAAAVHHFGIHDEATSKEAGSFADKMATLAAFLLGFYTSLTVSRWWRLRTDGVGNIWSSASQLSLFISQFVTRDPQILGALRRYARGSLSLVFLKRRYGADFVRKLDKLVDDDIFTLDEVEQLRAYNSNLAESVWTWVAHIVADLYKKGQIKSEMMLTFLMERVNLGRGGAALIGAQMGTPIPLPYVHFIGFLVKIHNIILGLSYGYMMGTTWKMDHFSVSQVFLTLKVFFIPLLYNAILLVNASLADPFSGEVNDFPWQKYQKGIESDGFSYIQAGEHLPMWMK